jgi:chromate transporter
MNADKPTFGAALRVWLKVAALSFGGPAGQIAVMHRILVDELRWVSESRFLHALNYCMLLPGPEAQQLATYLGWLMHGVRGGLAAGLLFVLPGFLSILALSLVYVVWGHTTVVDGLFYGVKPAIVAVVAQAVVRIGRRSLKNRTMIGVAVASFVAIYFFEVPFPAIVVAAAALGWIGGVARPERFAVLKGHDATDEQAENDGLASNVRPTWGRAAGVAATWLALWWLPVAALAGWFGRESVYVAQGRFFSQTALVTFGGAYSVLSYVAERCVEDFGWLGPREMLDGLAMAETTPGPLIQVVQFVGFLGAYRNPGQLSPLAAGVLGSVVTTWVTYAPCFLWIFVGAPYVERLRSNRMLTAALSTITAAVVGAILNLSAWFALHAVFGRVDELRFGPLRVLAPQGATLDPAALAIAVLAATALFRWNWGMLRTLAASAAAGLAWRLA